MGHHVLKVKNLTKQYPNGVLALNQLQFEIQSGEFVAVIGASGSGKSTLLRCLNGLTSPSSGQVLFGDAVLANEILQRSPETRRKMAMIFQQFNLVGRYSVLSNVLMGRLSNTPTFLSLLGRYSEESTALATEYLQMVGISEKSNMRADQLSGGQQQRVAIARALVQKPEILLADEPVASLDPVTSLAVMGELKKINQELGLTVICNLHSIGLVKKFAQRVLALKAGRIIFDGTMADLSQEIISEIYGEAKLTAAEIDPELEESVLR